ncbi:MAG: LysM peptidoglycan-binding domain-containing protein [Bdellovibrionales bacterium]|nr:LysM peptidoglycan-binding domain-containing protein [Bdellovibrionales bacterium]
MCSRTIPFVIVLCFLNLAGCQSFQRRIPLPPADLEPEVVVRPDFRHRVKFCGETLSAIARWYTGDRNNWTIIAQINQVDPKRIKVGSSLIIPSELVTVTDPFPRPSVQSSNVHSKANSDTSEGMNTQVKMNRIDENEVRRRLWDELSTKLQVG